MNSEVIAHYLCSVCQRTLEDTGRPESETVRDQFGVITNIDFARCEAAYTFLPESPVQSIIHHFKYSGMSRLAETFGQTMRDLLPTEIDVIIPVPLHRTRLAERGYNQAEALAKGIAPKKIVYAVKRTRPTPTQTHLTIPQRIENVRGAFALTRHADALRGKHVLIVDDVMTTGSTLAAVAETVLAAKPKTISTLTLAAANRQF
jgi:ComF family protein